MASPGLQAKAQELNVRIEGAAKIAIDEIERTHMRPLARRSYQCAVDCYDKAGTKGSSDQLEHCTRQCQGPYQQGNAHFQEEISQFQNRLSRSMMQCNDQANDMITPDMQDNPAKMKKVEDTVLKCIAKTVDNSIEMLGPMKKRMAAKLKNLS
uniref:Protein FAM136A n=1 Tax=Eucampia antarctica TaxID=49252 RepID=A0A7S2RM31_9STRA|mmetsp:Transcript_24026/g.23075  ORF Transcript_24026/g.23075 Transcript_24026/m.23075 type:complete len:153 (+) Transcript_24026:72-530(+)|eukprot:CAMPEP_0197833538 /NCGR_PEP_ID=MMETSP1437-20131217/19381_1 /TAXON_ID=49252 ORGANISM="Eucampia antarctica, Strain CCMP1452" /NCGR_SAMPLE_ID=MMETSP1437 /ASSEMBLY_ACC=CAM_ASM_001096 /LENGTH=152 /DNA_ID=CAMNT_0043437655 /DNA_START=72 /DNA_END=530 /DNA_ORIENTATION=+